ncbi:hypothetical protein ART_1421 [Arthrobacter sp. PAMC 25486]|uniref:hypothetical protein n=1 Tax=Arthrobacter sp. PAMC 25486 TaxID=1494608 RepID=UPI000535A497|nr:hypothetical protein [Arthrobacter sp. PAMC 25486]AIY01020.1 hypothetical protein ART_1421 [Arthrobacter sp. PAMC 25486]
MANTPPSYNPSPESSSGAGARVAPVAPVAPRQIGWVVKLLLAAAALQVVVTILSVINISSEAFRTRLRADILALGAGVDVEQLADGSVMFSMVTAVAVGVLSILMYLTIARFLAKGAMWARLLGGILAICSVYQASTVALPSGLVAMVQVLLGLVAIVLCYIKPGSTYFRETQIHKLLLKRK